MRSKTRTFVVMVILTVLFVWVGSMIGGRQGAIIAFLMAAVMNFGAYWFSDKLVLRHYRAQEVGPENHPRLYGIVSSLVQKAGLPMPKVYVVPQPNPNAFATGRNPQHAAVAATEGILQMLDDDELSGVMAHELTHVKNRDTLTSTVAATLAGAIAMMAQIARFQSRDPRRRQNPLLMIFILVGAPVAGMLLRSLISRIREYAADAGGAEISEKPMGLAKALEKLHRGVQQFPLAKGNPAHSQLFIMNPFFGGLGRLFSTHPPVEERIRRLQTIASNMGARSTR
jgi:heat shock protein HtpX